MAEVSVIRKNGNSPYVKITRQFKELGLNYGDEVEIVVRKYTPQIPTIPFPESAGSEPEFDVALVAAMFKSTLPPNVRLSSAEVQNRLNAWGGAKYTDDQRLKVLAYMSTRGMI